MTQSGNTQNTGAGTQRPNYVPGQNPKLDNPDPSRWFNTDAFVRVVNAYGNVGRNTLRQPGMKTWDIGLFKEFPVVEGQRFQFRWELSISGIRHSSGRQTRNWARRISVRSRLRGSITDNNRQMQFALKYLF